MPRFVVVRTTKTYDTSIDVIENCATEYEALIKAMMDLNQTSDIEAVKQIYPFPGYVVNPANGIITWKSSLNEESHVAVRKIQEV